MSTTDGNIPDFKTIKITTMTLIIPLKGIINLEYAFWLLKITRMNIPQPKRQTHKYKIPHCSEPGSILSVRYDGKTRGITRSTSSTHFKHSITIDISTIAKNISIKLSSSGVHMCGAKSTEQGQEATNYVINQLIKVQDFLDFCRLNPEKKDEFLSWVKQETRGPENFVANNGKLIRDHLIKEIKTESPIPVGSYIIDLINSLIPESSYHYEFCKHIEWICSLDHIITRPLEIDQIYTAMVNYNYDLGFGVNRSKLAAMISGYNGFSSKFENGTEHNVTIWLPYSLEDAGKTLRSKLKKPKHTFLVYRSGLVTQSGPGGVLMKDAYLKFNQAINEIKQLIIAETDRGRELKIKPKDKFVKPSDKKKKIPQDVDSPKKGRKPRVKNEHKGLN